MMDEQGIRERQSQNSGGQRASGGGGEEHSRRDGGERRGGRSGSGQTYPGTAPKRAARSDADSHKRQQRPESIETLAKMRNNAPLCAAYNAGGCREPCPRKELHQCSRVLRGGQQRACGLKHPAIDCQNHRRTGRNA